MTHVGRPPCDEGVIQTSVPGRTPCARSAEPWILAATILGSSLAFIDGTVVNVALAALQAEFSATSSDLQWVVEAYGLFLSALLLVGGSLGDRFGRRRIFMLGVLIFAAASLWCGLVTTMVQLHVARAVQGAGAALLVPGSLALISASFDEKTRGRAIGTWSGFTGITTAFGPVLGGWFIEHASWRWVFFINVPIAMAVLAICAWRVPESQDDDEAAPLDWAGALVATCGLAGVVFGLIESSNRGWRDPAVLIALAAGTGLLAAFLAIEARVRAPMLPLTLFRSPSFTGANLVTWLLYAGLGGAMYFLPLNLLQVQHYSPTAAGSALLPLIVIMFLLSRWAGGLVQRYGARRPLVIGPAIAAIGFALLARPGIGGGYWRTFFPAIVVLGFGMVITVAPLTTVVMNAVARRHAGVASGVNNAVARTAGLLAIALMGILLTAAFNRDLDSRLAVVSMPASVRADVDAERPRLAGAQLPATLREPGAREAVRQALDLAFVSGFRAVMWLSAALAFAASLTAWRMLDPARERGAGSTADAADDAPRARRGASHQREA